MMREKGRFSSWERLVHRIFLFFFFPFKFFLMGADPVYFLFIALGTKAVGEFGLAVFRNILLHLFPVPIIIPYLFTSATDGQDPAELFDFRQSLFQLFIFFQNGTPLMLNGQVSPEAGQDLLLVERFGDIIHSAGFKSLEFVVKAIEGGHENYRDRVGGRVVFETAAGFEPINTGHHDIEEDDVGKFSGDQLQGPLAAVGNENVKIRFLQDPQEYFQVGRLVINNKNGILGRGFGHFLLGGIRKS